MITRNLHEQRVKDSLGTHADLNLSHLYSSALKIATIITV